MTTSSGQGLETVIYLVFNGIAGPSAWMSQTINDYKGESNITVNQHNFTAVKLRGFGPFWVIIGNFSYILLFN